MNRSPNPYEPPRTISWWERFITILAGRSSRTGDERFLAGEAVIHYGVLFQVDPNNTQSLTTSLPLAVDHDEYVRRNIEEACRVAAEFVMAHPNLLDTLRDRELVVSMISSYADRKEIRRELIPARQWNHRIATGGG